MFYRLHCFHPPTDCRLCLCEFCLDTGWNYRLEFGGNSIRTRVRNAARSFFWTHTALPSHLRSAAVIVIIAPCGGSVFEVSHLYCSSSCTAWCSWGCLLMWLFKLFMLVVAKSQLQHLPGAFRKKKKRDRDRAAYLTGKCSYRSSILMSVCWDKGLGAKQAGHSYFNKRNKSVFSISLHLHCGWAMKLALPVA